MMRVPVWEVVAQTELAVVLADPQTAAQVPEGRAVPVQAAAVESRQSQRNAYRGRKAPIF